MGFLDNSTITVDAILTKRGREILSQGGNFKISKFALSDEEIDYSLYDTTHPNGTDSYGAVIENISLLEASPNKTEFKSFLVNKTLAGAKLTVAATSYSDLDKGDPITIEPATSGQFKGEMYNFIIDNTSIVGTNSENVRTSFTAKILSLVAKSFRTPSTGATAAIKVTGMDSALTTTITINVNADTEGTDDAYANNTTQQFIDDLKTGTGEGLIP
tara:strand:- start:2287 stop:2934 length:648 start_codon:yes stop_codon:yes gene_type:complete